MRSILKAAAGAALILSSSILGAAAQGQGYGNHMTYAQPSVVTSRADGQPPVASTAAHRQQAAVATHAMRPREARIMSELQAAQQRINADARHGWLTRSERKRLEGEMGRINRQAAAMAGRHHGAIPIGSYRRLQKEVAGLSRDIHRLSNNGVHS